LVLWRALEEWLLERRWLTLFLELWGDRGEFDTRPCGVWISNVLDLISFLVYYITPQHASPRALRLAKTRGNIQPGPDLCLIWHGEWTSLDAAKNAMPSDFLQNDLIEIQTRLPMHTVLGRHVQISCLSWWYADPLPARKGFCRVSVTHTNLLVNSCISRILSLGKENSV
jgi:hypothetical protein